MDLKLIFSIPYMYAKRTVEGPYRSNTPPIKTNTPNKLKY